MDPQQRRGDCGACNSTCGGGTVCTGGLCGCPQGTKLCNGSCVNTATNANNCGACNTKCLLGQVCVNGLCK
ncbi:MAG: hypothetical protein EXR72_16220 [Myxococcales bacterium]|nr:hypothetical protein [Myxococcales bacterium]